MPTPAPSRVPAHMHAVTPHLVCAGAARALDFYRRAFGAEETFRLPGPDGLLMHASMRFGDATVMLTDEMPQCQSFGPRTLKGTPVTLHLYVPDADAAFDKAVAAGATPVMPPADMFWGDRYAVVEDPFGHRWSIAHQQWIKSPEEILRDMASAMPPGASS